MSRISEQVEWLSLIDISGPFLAASLLEEAFPQGLEKVETPRRQRIRSAYEEWRDALDANDPQLQDLHAAWTEMVLQEMLEYDDRILIKRQALNQTCVYNAPEHGVRITPDYAVRGDDGRLRLLVAIWPPETDLERPVATDRWPASPVERMTVLCRANGVRLGLVTNGERWMLINAPVGGTSGYAAWLARLWWQEPITLKAFQTLLGVRRCFGPEEETLESLIDRSLEFQEDVTDTLGEQVRRAVEILIQSLGRSDQDRNGDLLEDVRPADLYEAGLTVMMRLVFTLCAEERGLLLLGDPIYDQHYAISTLRARLREDADRYGVEVLERRHDAWSRLLAVFRAIYGGIEHESLRMPAMGSSLFDPDRFPFLEGRAKGTTWRETPAVPLPIDNRTVLLLLDALQVLEQRGGAQLLSYRALDVEQIGHVYEGLLEYTARKLSTVTLGLVGSRSQRHSIIALGELERLVSSDAEKASEMLSELTGRSQATIGSCLRRPPPPEALPALINACGGDEQLARRLHPFDGLIRHDSWGQKLIYQEGAFAIVHGAERRDTGTHYTPRSITETIVSMTLEPGVYGGPTEGKPREEWKLKDLNELLDLRVCDPAMGSGAFLVQACRYLAERIVEAWQREEQAGKSINIDGRLVSGSSGEEPLPRDLNDRLIIARRLVAERCLYGVDINPLAVELAKLSMWLTTMARGRPFGFLDHNFKCGDSLLGLHRSSQLTQLQLIPGEHDQPQLFGRTIATAVAQAVDLRKRLRSSRIRDIRDIQAMALLEGQAHAAASSPLMIADALVAGVLRCCHDKTDVDSMLTKLAMRVDSLTAGDARGAEEVRRETGCSLALDLPAERTARRPFHWPIEFPEVFARDNPGFDAVVGNPPFMYGKHVSGRFGKCYSGYLASLHPWATKNADLCVQFFLRAFALIRNSGTMGLLATKTIAEGDSRESGLEWIGTHGGTIFAAFPSEPWPGRAAVVTSRVHIIKGEWSGSRVLSGGKVPLISSYLSSQDISSPTRLKENVGVAFQGSTVLGEGHLLTVSEAESLIRDSAKNREVLFPYLNGDELNSDPEQRPSRWVVNFFDWPEAKAKQYQAVYRLLKERVYPERLEKSSKTSYKDIMSMWWRFWRPRAELYAALGRASQFVDRTTNGTGRRAALKKVLVIARTSKTGAFVFVPNEYVISDAVVVFARDDYRFFAILQSTIHVCYAWCHSSKLKSDLRYSHSDCFETFPMPAENASAPALERIGREFHSLRTEYLKHHSIGLTQFYARFHDPGVRDKQIEQLRQLQVDMDNEVVRSYGFNDLRLEHAFHEVGYLPADDRTRFTISEKARVTAIDLLARLNQQRAEAQDEA